MVKSKSEPAMYPVVECLLREHRVLDSIPSITATTTTTATTKNSAQLSDSRVGNVKLFEDKGHDHYNSLPIIRAVTLNRGKGAIRCFNK